MKKLGRNDSCHCGSGKKFKKCCESKMIRGRFLATPLSQAPGASMQGRALNLSSLFQAHVVQPKPVISAPVQENSAAVEKKSESLSTQTLEGKGDILVSS